MRRISNLQKMVINSLQQKLNDPLAEEETLEALEDFLVSISFPSDTSTHCLARLHITLHLSIILSHLSAQRKERNRSRAQISMKREKKQTSEGKKSRSWIVHQGNVALAHCIAWEAATTLEYGLGMH